MQITYIILLIMIFIFHILYKGDLSFILLVFLTAMPVLLFILLIIQTAKLNISISSSSKASERGKPEVIKIFLENTAFFPVTACRLTFRYKCFFPPDKPVNEKYSVIIPVSQLSKETLTVSFTPKHCGYIDISSARAAVYDIIGLTFIFKKIQFNDRITVLPKVYPFSSETERSFSYNAEGDTFSQTRSGDDPSEIFELREYRSGDSLNHIHWKLSSRGEKFIVKELSKPISSKILILCDTGSCRTASDTDKIFDITATLSSFLVNAQAAHTLTVPSGDGLLFTSEISGQESLISAVAELCSGQAAFSGRSTDEKYFSETAELVRKGFSHILAVSADDDKTFISELSRICGETLLTVFCASPASDTDDKDEPISTEIIYSAAEELDEKVSGYYSGKYPYK